jgi:hypothetical protein
MDSYIKSFIKKNKIKILEEKDIELIKKQIIDGTIIFYYDENNPFLFVSNVENLIKNSVSKKEIYYITDKELFDKLKI